MTLRRIFIFIIIILMMASFGPVFAAPAPTMSIKVTDMSGAPLGSGLVQGDVVRVGVYMADFPGLSIALPSIHFNPDVLEAFDPVNSTIYPDGIYNIGAGLSSAFFTAGQATDGVSSGWGGSFVNATMSPYLNNKTGLIRMLADSGSKNNLVGEQSVYFVYMRVKAAGDADLRFTAMQDGLVDINNPSLGFKPNEHEWYDPGVFPQFHDLKSRPVYAIYGGNFADIVTESDTILTEPSSVALLTEISVDPIGLTNYCYEGDIFAFKIYVKNIPDMYSITIPLVYDTERAKLLYKNHGEVPDVVLDPNSSLEDIKSIVTLPSNLTLVQNNVYPLVDTVRGFVDILALPTVGNKININDNKTLVCTLYFKALKEGDFEYRFPTIYDETGKPTGETIYDPASPGGVMLTGTRSDVGLIGAMPVLPEYSLAKLRIGKIILGSTSEPGEVIVYPLHPYDYDTPEFDKADIMVADVAEGAIVKLYYKDAFGNLIPIMNELGVHAVAVASPPGYAVFINIDIKAIDGYIIWATATEEGKEESEATWGTPDETPVIHVIERFKPTIPFQVSINTPAESITKFEATVIAETAYYVSGYTYPFSLPSGRDQELRVIDSGWDSTNYNGNTNGVYQFYSEPHPDDLALYDLILIDDLGIPGYTAEPPLQHVTIDSGGGNGGNGGNGGGGGYVPSNSSNWRDPVVPKPVAINDIDHYRYLHGYPDGTIQPERHVSREEVAAIFYRLLTSQTRSNYRTKENPFPDVTEENWSLVEISTLSNAGIVKGDLNTHYNPLNMITRAEFATIATRFDSLNENATHGLIDISGHWAERQIAAAYQMGWVNGYEDGTFRPDEPITRAEAAKLINQVLKRRVDQEGLLAELVIEWPDLPVEHWAYYEIMEATISHEYNRRYDDRVMENWTGPAPDINFDIE